MLKYNNTSSDVFLYKDFFVVYKNLIIDFLKRKEIPSEVEIINNNLINVNRAPLIVLKRTDCPQPPSAALLNENRRYFFGKEQVEGRSINTLNIAVLCYGNTYIECERLGAGVFEAILTSSIQKIRRITDNKIVGHELLGWSESRLPSANSKLFESRIDFRITVVFDYSDEISKE